MSLTYVEGVKIGAWKAPNKLLNSSLQVHTASKTGLPHCKQTHTPAHSPTWLVHTAHTPRTQPPARVPDALTRAMRTRTHPPLPAGIPHAVRPQPPGKAPRALRPRTREPKSPGAQATWPVLTSHPTPSHCRSSERPGPGFPSSRSILASAWPAYPRVRPWGHGSPLSASSLGSGDELASGPGQALAPQHSTGSRHWVGTRKCWGPGRPTPGKVPDD